MEGTANSSDLVESVLLQEVNCPLVGFMLLWGFCCWGVFLFGCLFGVFFYQRRLWKMG